MNTREVGEPSRGARCRRMGGTGTVDVEDMSKMEKEWGGRRGNREDRLCQQIKGGVSTCRTKLDHCSRRRMRE